MMPNSKFLCMHFISLQNSFASVDAIECMHSLLRKMLRRSIEHTRRARRVSGAGQEVAFGGVYSMANMSILYEASNHNWHVTAYQ